MGELEKIAYRLVGVHPAPAKAGFKGEISVLGPCFLFESQFTGDNSQKTKGKIEKSGYICPNPKGAASGVILFECANICSPKS